MKTSLRIAAACACLSASILSPQTQAAEAAKVQLYGLLDSGLEYANHLPGNATTAGTASGTWSGSRWGMRGSEDLGNGLHSVFALESGFNLTDGTSLQGGRLFGRQAYVGLDDKDMGRLTFGRQNTLMIDWMSKFNPFGNSNLSGKRIDPAFSDRMDNSVKYTKQFGPVTFGTYYSFGWNNDTDPDDKRLGRMLGVGLRYADSGLTAAVLYHHKNTDTVKTGATSANHEDRILAGVSYDMDLFKVYGGYRWLDQRLVARNYTSNLFWAGVTYRVHRNTKLSAVIYHMNGTVCDAMNAAACPATEHAGHAQQPSLITLGAEYDLSKRTMLYALASYALNNHGSSVSLMGGKYGANVEPGENQFGAAIGMLHRF